MIEQFSQVTAGSYRVPLAWASAQFEQRKHDVVRVQIGMATDLQASFFSSVAFTNPTFTLELPASEEPRLREFLQAAARTAGRSTYLNPSQTDPGLRLARQASVRRSSDQTPAFTNLQLRR